MRAVHLHPGSRPAAVAAAGVGAAVDVGYVLLVQGQTAEGGSGAVFLVAFLGTMAALALAGAAVRTIDERVAQAMLYGATAGYVVAGLVGLASIGLFLIVAGLLAIIAAGPRRVQRRSVATIAAVPMAVFIIGTALTAYSTMAAGRVMTGGMWSL